MRKRAQPMDTRQKDPGTYGDDKSDDQRDRQTEEITEIARSSEEMKQRGSTQEKR
jgi:hypothetical protein